MKEKVCLILLSFFLIVTSYSQNWENTELDTLFNNNGEVLSIENRSSAYHEALTFEYDDLGNLSKVTYITQRNGIQYEKVTTYYTNGNKAKEYFYYVRNKLFYGVDELDSTYTEYYKSGALRSKRNFISGKEHGISLVYYENGEVSTKLDFTNGRLMNVKSYDHDGNLLSNGDFENGNGELIHYENGVKVSVCKYKNGRLRKRTCVCF